MNIHLFRNKNEQMIDISTRKLLKGIMLPQRNQAQMATYDSIDTPFCKKAKLLGWRTVQWLLGDGEKG